jgi:N utilization substance protein A
MLGRGIVLVREDQLSLAIGRRGQNVRLASKLCGWDIEIMTREELDQQIERAVTGFASIPGLDESVAEKLVGEGFLSYDDLSVIEPDDLMEMGGLSSETVDEIVAEAEERAAHAEAAAADERRKQREQDRIDRATAEADAVEQAITEAREAKEAIGDEDGGAAGSPPPQTAEQASEAAAEGASPTGGRE